MKKLPHYELTKMLHLTQNQVSMALNNIQMRLACDNCHVHSFLTDLPVSTYQTHYWSEA